MYKALLRPLLFRTSASDPETAHHQVISLLAFASRYPPLLKLIEVANSYKSPALERDLLGLHFPNPLGLAGGFDKNGLALPAFAALGFGFIEAGTVTRYKQPGNPRPRIVRFSKDSALINRMGFPNDGADEIHRRLSGLPKPAIPVGWSLGKSKVTPEAEAVEDYLYSLRQLSPFSDFFTLNVSSPNTPGLRKLQDKALLDQLLQATVYETETLAREEGLQAAKPLLVKIAPDLTESQIDDVLEVCLARNVRGLIATNTTLSRTGLQQETLETGGLSGRPLSARSLEVVHYLCKQLNGRIPVIGVGGIMEPDDARRMFDAGASLIQIYTSFIYGGPGIVKQMNKALAVSGGQPGTK